MKCKVIETTFAYQDAQGFTVLLEPETLIGDGTPYPVPKGTQRPKVGPYRGQTIPRFIPGPNLEALDDEAREVQDKYAPKENLTLDDMPVHVADADNRKQTKDRAKGF